MSIQSLVTFLPSADNQCGICFDNLNNGQEVVAHTGEHGNKHPAHRNCIEQWLRTQPICPFCFVGITPPPPPLKDRIIKELELMGRDARSGAEVGLVAALSALITVSAVSAGAALGKATELEAIVSATLALAELEARGGVEIATRAVGIVTRVVGITVGAGALAAGAGIGAVTVAKAVGAVGVAALVAEGGVRFGVRGGAEVGIGAVLGSAVGLAFKIASAVVVVGTGSVAARVAEAGTVMVAQAAETGAVMVAGVGMAAAAAVVLGVVQRRGLFI